MENRSQIDKWKDLGPSWYNAKPPSIPSPEDLRIYRRGVEQVLHKVVLILGCTPSLRELVGSQVQPRSEMVVIVDFLEEMHDTTTRALNVTWKEQFVCADWCEPFESPIADVILGDRALDNIEAKRRSLFFENVRRHVHRGGLFVNHTAVSDNVIEACPVADLVDRWADLEASGKQDHLACMEGLWDDLLTNSLRHTGREGVLSIAPLVPELRRIEEAPVENGYEGTRSHLVSELLARYHSSLYDEWYTSTLDDVIKKSEPYFRLEHTRFADDYKAAEHHPFLFMRAI